MITKTYRRGTPEEIIDEINPILAGRRPSMVQVVLASLVASWLETYPKAHQPDLRRDFNENVSFFLRHPYKGEK